MLKPVRSSAESLIENKISVKHITYYIKLISGYYSNHSNIISITDYAFDNGKCQNL